MVEGPLTVRGDANQMTERDEATGLDHTWWRKYESSAGRWTSPDPYGGSMTIGDPQSFNRYSYVENDPVNFVDPSGLLCRLRCKNYFELRKPCESISLCDKLEEALDELHLAHRISPA
jgi:RHS repeat-associated protein